LLDVRQLDGSEMYQFDNTYLCQFEIMKFELISVENWSFGNLKFELKMKSPNFKELDKLPFELNKRTTVIDASFSESLEQRDLFFSTKKIAIILFRGQCYKFTIFSNFL
jgi:hypothetical protein